MCSDSRKQRYARTIIWLSVALACSRPPADRDIASLMESGRLKQAIQAATSRLQKQPQDHTARLLLADALSRQSEFKQIQQLLKDHLHLGAPALDAKAALLLAHAQCMLENRFPTATFARAESLMHAAPELEAEFLIRRATCHYVTGDRQAAAQGFRQAADHPRATPFWRATAQMNLAVWLMQEERYDEAAELLQSAALVAEQRQYLNLLAKIAVNQGLCYDKLGDYDRAERRFTRAAQLFEPEDANARQALALYRGVLYYHQSDFARALQAFRQGLEIARRREDRRAIGRLLTNLAAVAIEQGDLTQASHYAQEALLVKQKLADPVSLDYSRLLLADIHRLRGDMDAALPIYLEIAAKPSAPTEARLTALSGAASVALARRQYDLASRRFRLALDLAAQSTRRLHNTEHRLSMAATIAGLYDAYVEFLVQRGRIREALAVAETSRSRLLAEKIGRPLRPPKALLPRATPRNHVVLYYWLMPAKSFLCVIKPQGARLVTLPGERQIAEDVKALNQLVLSSKDPRAGQGPAQRLYQTLVAPARIPPGSQVLIVPDGPLFGLNFELLVSDQRFWIEDVVIAVAPALHVLEQSQPPPLHQALLIGNPLPAPTGLPPLPHANREFRELHRLLGDAADAFEQQAATPELWRRISLERYGLIHLAAHAVANVESPLDSAIILSPARSEYKLYARDILARRLQAHLVTLSACRGAGARTYAGEGLVGLAWAFLAAGARNVVAGLWEVEDASTTELMHHFYRYARAGLPPAPALRLAKLHLLRSSSAWRKPFYWAPFVIYTRQASLPSADIQ